MGVTSKSLRNSGEQRIGLAIYYVRCLLTIVNQFTDGKTSLSADVAFRKGVREGAAWGNWSGG